MLKKLAAIGLTVGALVLAAPLAATAAPSDFASTASDPYADDPSVSVGDPVIDLCEVSTITFGAGYFLPGERVGVSVSGLNAADAQVSGNTAAADGGMVVSFRAPADGHGSYSVAITGAERAYTATITVADGRDSTCSPDQGSAPGDTELPLTGSSNSGMELALTGGDVSPWILGGGAAALIAGGVLIAAGAARHRRA